MTDRWLSLEETAIYLGVSKDTIYAYVSDGNIPKSRIGRLWKFKKSELDRWVKSGLASDVYNMNKKGS